MPVTDVPSRFDGGPRADRDAAPQLRAGKDPNKAKKNKDGKDGTSSPSSSSGTGRDSNASPVLTPSSSTSTLNDLRNKPLPPNSAALAAEHASQGIPSQPPQLGSLNPAQGSDRFSGLGAPGQAPNGGNTPVRHGPLPPTVIISPSAPVRP